MKETYIRRVYAFFTGEEAKEVDKFLKDYPIYTQKEVILEGMKAIKEKGGQVKS